MTKVIITGSNGLIGSKFVATYRDQYQLVEWNRSGTPSVDITNKSQLAEMMAQHSDATALIHLAAYTDVTGAYAQTGDKTGPAWQINVVGTQNLVELCRQHQIKLILMSTAYVFDGANDLPYTEDDIPHPIEWYGQTKYEAEQLVANGDLESLIFRIDQPFSRTRSPKTDTLWRVITGLQDDNLYPQFTNHFFGPTYIEDLVRVLDFALRTGLAGLWHASNGEQWSDYEFASLVAKVLDLPGTIKKGNLDDYLATLARPYQRNTALDNSKLREHLDFSLHTIEQAVAETILK